MEFMFSIVCSYLFRPTQPVGEAYEKQLLMLDCPSLTYVAFDFHHHW